MKANKTAFKWKKLGRIFNPADHPGRYFMDEFAQAPSVIVYDDFFRVYFSCRPKADANGQYVSYSAFADFKKQEPFEVIRVSDNPILGLGERGTFDEFGTYPVSVIKEDDHFYAFFGGWTRCESVPFNVAIGFAESKDGVCFVKSGPGPVLSYSLHEPFVLSGPKIRKYDGKYYLFYIAGRKWINDNGRMEPVYKIRLAVSTDMRNWELANKDLIDSRIEEDEAQASPDVIYYNGKYHMFFCYRYSTRYRSHEFGYRIGYAYSEDLVNWTREDAVAGIDVSAEGWDSEMISYPHVFLMNNKLYMLYLGNQVGRYGFGIAVLDQDDTI